LITSRPLKRGSEAEGRNLADIVEYNDFPLWGRVGGTDTGQVGLVGGNAYNFHETVWHTIIINKDPTIISAYVNADSMYTETVPELPLSNTDAFQNIQTGNDYWYSDKKGYKLREPAVPYGANFTPESDLLRLKNTYFWDDII